MNGHAFSSNVEKDVKIDYLRKYCKHLSLANLSHLPRVDREKVASSG
jgi:hypothetical protein